MTRALTILFIASLVAGCGLKGDLERPEPLWGDPRPTAGASGFPGAERGGTSDVVFTRDDVAIFEDESEEDDLFEDENEDDVSDAGSGASTIDDADPAAE